MFSNPGYPTPFGAGSDVGMYKIMETAALNYPGVAADVLLQHMSEVPMAEAPQMKDQFGLPVNPISLLPSWVVGVRQVSDLLASDGAMRAVYEVSLNDVSRRRLLGVIVTRYQLADALVTEYRLAAAHQPVGPEPRASMIDQIGRLLNANDLYMKQFFGLDTINPSVKDGTVRAQALLDVVDADLRDEGVRKAAVDIYAAIQSTDSYYKDLSLQELHCRINAANVDADASAHITEARDLAAKYAASKQAIIQRTLEYDAKVRADPSPRPQGSDEYLSPATTSSSTVGSAGPSSGQSSGTMQPADSLSSRRGSPAGFDLQQLGTLYEMLPATSEPPPSPEVIWK